MHSQQNIKFQKGMWALGLFKAMNSGSDYEECSANYSLFVDIFELMGFITV
jgi:hypothetical protein